MSTHQLTLVDLAINPMACLPARSIYCLHAFINGVNSPEATDGLYHLEGFAEWLSEQLDLEYDGIYEAHQLVLRYLSPDPQEAYFAFLVQLEAYCTEQGDIWPALLEGMRTRPRDYVAVTSVYTLLAYLWGMEYRSQGMIAPRLDLAPFEEWLRSYYEQEGAWYELLLLHAMDEYGALQQFMILYKTFALAPSHLSDSAALEYGKG